MITGVIVVISVVIMILVITERIATDNSQMESSVNKTVL